MYCPFGSALNPVFWQIDVYCPVEAGSKFQTGTRICCVAWCNGVASLRQSSKPLGVQIFDMCSFKMNIPTDLHRMPCALAPFPDGLQLVEVAEPDARLVAVLIHAAVVLLFLLGSDGGGPSHEKLVLGE